MIFLDSAGKLSRIGDAERVRKWVESIPVGGGKSTPLAHASAVSQEVAAN
jgi:D-alanyl-D-alanine endopeptidase (penicillin-binding protein 7)